MADGLADLPFEARYLLTCCGAVLDLETAPDLGPVPEEFEVWARTIYLAACHHVGSLCGQVGRSLGAPFYVGQIFDSLLATNEVRAQAYASELERVSARFADAGVTALVRKGGYLAYNVYAKPAWRELSDIDLLVPSDQADRAAAVLRSFGYTHGRPISHERRIEPLSRRARVSWRMNASSLPGFVRPVEDPVVGFLRIDVRFDLLEPASELRLPMEDWFEEARAAPAPEGVLVSSPEHFFLDVVSHLYREATTVASVRGGKDLRLLWFADIPLMLRDEAFSLDLDRLCQLADKYGLADQLYFALHFTDMLFPGSVPRSLAARVRPDDLAFLDDYGELDRQRARWDMPFLERFFDPDRKLKAKGERTFTKW